MVRTFGAKDKRKRKTRSDKGKLHKQYRGKKLPEKRAKKIKFNSEKGNKTHIKLWVWRREKMSQEGLKNWDKKLRGKVKKTIYKWEERIDVPVSELIDKEHLENWAFENIRRPGEFLIMSLTGSPKARYRVKWTKFCSFIIRIDERGLHPRVTGLYSIYRYWFWSGNKKISRRMI